MVRARTGARKNVYRKGERAMARGAVGKYASIFWLPIRGGLRQVVGRVSAHPLFRPALPFRPDRLLIAPQDLRTADATRAAEIYSGRFAFAGKVVICDSRSIFEMDPPSEEWAVELLGFGWLRHLRAADSAITRANARALVDEWIAVQGSWHPIGWRPDVLSRRIISWLSQAVVVLQDADVRFYRRFLRSLVRQVHYLRLTTGDARRGVAHLQAMIALAEAALCIAGQAQRIKSATAHLAQALDREILPDGGHAGRDPGAIIEVLLELLPLRQAYTSRNMVPPPALLHAIDRMMPMLRFFRHSDGSFAHFNGMGATPADLLLTLLAYDDVRGTPLSNASHSGYQRLEAGGSVLIVDVGRVPPIELSLEAHAGCLSFEFSSPKGNLIVVNCGVPPTGREYWRQLARATPAHATATFDDTSSARFLVSPALRQLLGGAPMLDGPNDVEVTREERPDMFVLRAAHNGYARKFGVVHQRTLALFADGTRLEGEDVFSFADSRRRRGGGDQYVLRFHLHPAVKATRLGNGQGAVLVTPDREVWTFTVADGEVDLEDSVYLATTEGPRRTAQLAVYGGARGAPRVAWSFQVRPPGLSRSLPHARSEEPKPPT
jgi:uncharacterized heparinase superfamily protein